jgi:hypothetical protein
MPEQIKPISFTAKYPGLMNKIITDAGVSLPFKVEEVNNNSVNIHNTQALWDTGASGSVVTQSTAKALNLIPIGSAMVSHAGGQSLHNRYLVNIVLPNKVMICGIPVTECPDTAGNFGVIIGMDVIAGGDFAVTNFQGKTVVSFRIPSIQEIDFVEEAKKINIKPNAPCPCGKKTWNKKSVKYKNCCGK